MKDFFRELKKFSSKMKFYWLILLLFLILAGGSLMLLQHEVLVNARRSGNKMARSYVVEEERNGTAYESLLLFGAARLERFVQEGITEESLESWFSGFCTDIESVAGAGKVDLYAVVNGRIVAANPWEGDDTYDYAATEWYQDALKAEGKVVYTDAYMDAIYNRSVITMSVRSGEGENVMAFDIFPENFRITEQSMDLPESSSYFLCDSEGTLLYAQTELNADRDEIQRYMDKIINRIENGELDDLNSYIYDLTGQRRAVYWDTAENGWISVITVPYSTILGNLYFFTIGFSVIFALVTVFFLISGLWGYGLNRRVEKTNETVRVLGNSYYAIYRVDYTKGTYDMIKGSDYVRKRLPEKGEYDRLIRVVTEIVDESASRDFAESFSLENMRDLVRKRVKDYGGDFLRLFDEGYRWVNVRLLFDESLCQNEVVLCFREVEEEKQAQIRHIQLLENALDKAKKSEASQGRFFSSMSHDMRTPLNAIIGLSELAAHAESMEKIREYVKKITVSSRQLLGLINDILELSRMERGKVELNREVFDLKQCIEECTDVFRTQADQQGKQFSVEYDMQDCLVKGDPSRIIQIMNNLISNAVKFTESGGRISVKIHQAEVQEYTKYQFIVSDTGRGMSEEFLKKIYEPYAREVRFGANNVPGTGLGMPIVKSLVSQMDGQITVESRLGEGSTFIITLPLETIQEEKKEFSDSPDREKEEEKFDLKGRRILLAEDNDVNMEIATELLEMSGIEVVQAWNGREAVERFSESEEGYFDAVLMDMQMPEMNGCDASRAIRAMERRDAVSVPILAVTANAFAEDIAATTAAGMNAHISKPIDLSILYSVLEEQIRLRKEKEKEKDE